MKYILDLLKKRHTVRCFVKKDFILRKYTALILEAARWIPSAKNLQPLEFILIESQEKRRAVAIACHQSQPVIVPLVIAVIGNLNISKLLGKLSSHSKSTSSKATSIFIYMELGAAVQNMLLVATELGLDSLWISSFSAKQLRNALELPKHYVPLAIICFGHRYHPPFSPAKRSISERLHKDRFINKKIDLSYLKECKQINEENGELKKYK